MSNLINYIATGANALKNWDIMTRAATTKISVEKDFRFWSFHEMFMNHIKNLGWITYLVFAEAGTDYNIAKDFGQVRIETIDAHYQSMEVATQTTDNTQNKITRPLHLAFQIKCQIRSIFTCQRKRQSSLIRTSGLEATYHKYFMRHQTRNLSCTKHDPYAFLREF